MSGYISEENRLGAGVRRCGSDIEDFVNSVEVSATLNILSIYLLFLIILILILVDV